MNNEEAVAQLRKPLPLLHGDRDLLIPLAHSPGLAARAPQASLVLVSEAAHADLQDFDAYLAALAKALR